MAGLGSGSRAYIVRGSIVKIDVVRQNPIVMYLNICINLRDTVEVAAFRILLTVLWRVMLFGFL
jgi:hypothetical protein